MPLVAGSPSELAAVAPDADAPLAFSVLLNLLALLDRAVAYETAEGTHHPDLSGRVAEPATKRQGLASRLEAAAALRMRSLLADGQIAVRALLVELELPRTWGMLHVTRLPRWGTIAISAHYTASDEA